jgi:hypothetical protein
MKLHVSIKNILANTFDNEKVKKKLIYLNLGSPTYQIIIIYIIKQCK